MELPQKPLDTPRPAIGELSGRSREVLRQIVDAYVTTGEPVGSRAISRRLGMSLSPATIRNVMADLEEAGLLYAPHTSAGRLPTELGLRMFVDGLLEIGSLTEDERRNIETQCQVSGRSLPQLLEEATGTLSGLSRCAGLVLAPKTDRPLKHIEFVYLGPGRAMVVLVTEGGIVENRVVELPLTVPVSALTEASNYLNRRLVGKTLGEAHADIARELREQRAELDGLTKRVVETGLASWGGGESATNRSLIVRGQAHLLDDVAALQDLERVRTLFAALETKESVAKLLEEADRAEGVRIFIGSENELFNLAGCSAIVAPYRDSQNRIVGAVGVIGPARMNYARIIPLVDFTAQVIGRAIG